MTLIGKCLVVAQVILSLMFMALAGAVYSTQTSWKTEHDKVSVRLDGVQKELNDKETALENARNEKKTEVTKWTEAAQKAEADNSNLKNDIDALNTKLETIEAERDGDRSLANSSANEARMRQEESKILRKVNANLHESIDRMTAEARAMRDELFTKDVASQTMAERHKAMLEEFAFLKKIIRINGIDSDPKAYIAKTQPPPVVDGWVLEARFDTRQGTDFAEVSIGSDDGLAKGHILYAFRTKGEIKYLGKIEIVAVYPDRAVGTIIDKAKNGIIREGDNVTTKL